MNADEQYEPGSRGAAVVLANRVEGEPVSWKDRLLMAVRPHLVLDGAFAAAAAVGADQVVVYVGERHAAGLAALAGALAERRPVERRLARLVAAPDRYVAGEETAAVQFVNAGRALPTTVPPRPFERGIAARPTLVQNVESLTHTGRLARFGDLPGTRLVSLSEAVAAARCANEPPGAVLLGGSSGAWVEVGAAWAQPVACGVVSVLPRRACGVCETARILHHLAGESAAQCGPCFFGLRAIADASARIAWDRGACRHPDGAAGLLASALPVFAAEFERHPAHVRGQAA